MARPLVLVLDGVEYPVGIVKVDRDKLYGKMEIEAFDEKGREAEIRVLAADGKTLINKGGTALATVTDKGDSVDRNALVPVNEDGEKIEQVPSSFNQNNILENAEVDDYLLQIVKSVYLLTPFEDADISPLMDQITAGQIYNFPFSYRGGVEYDSAFVIGSGKDAFIVTGKQAELDFIKLNESSVLNNDEEDEISVDDLDFDLM
ncbi:MAG TPA: hypothetical protein PLR83_07290 [Pyrinomonadaceae bacterium]|nr:hypothetical protein [Pyrinomonadaceae bacterium]